jgi:hypothetical protein
MGLMKNSYGAVDLLATCTELDKRLTALEEKVSPPTPSKPAPKHEWGVSSAPVAEKDAKK